ncbi:hypothetical protein F8388_022686 [Cannabis sativa]|uniref:Uncharacterized protein n=1 Tax=Cannabis sativa TaxID=3483 RepID=A0A7J6G4G5_CANSA|nr:hypothetical protein F8388_022686 [Cannabis sativa]
MLLVQSHIQTLRGRVLETILSLRFFMFQYGIVYKLHLSAKERSLAVCFISPICVVASISILYYSSRFSQPTFHIFCENSIMYAPFTLQVFTYSPKKSAYFHLVLRFTQGVTSLGLIAAIALVVIFTDLSMRDLFASILAFIPTGWAIICLAVTWKRVFWSLGLWDSVREFAKMYDAAMGMLIFAPIALISWFPFRFSYRPLFNQAFTRGLEISTIIMDDARNKWVGRP